MAVIPDGNGRWAAARLRPRTDGHRAGARAVRRTVECAPAHGIGMLTIYAFSSDNWHRPASEVHVLMKLFEQYLRGETARCVGEGVRVRVVGRRDRLAERLVHAIEATEAATAACDRLRLNLAVDYSSRDAIGKGALLPEVDLLIRTGGERRLSDFLLWECAYAELYFTNRRWPDFGARDLTQALADYHGRERRYGRLPAAPPTTRLAISRSHRDRGKRLPGGVPAPAEGDSPPHTSASSNPIGSLHGSRSTRPRVIGSP